MGSIIYEVSQHQMDTTRVRFVLDKGTGVYKKVVTNRPITEATLQSYRTIAANYIKYCRAHHTVHITDKRGRVRDRACRRVAECQPHIQDYIDYLVAQGKSPSTIHTYAAGLCHFYGKPLAEYILFIDGTHIKASANLNKKIKQEVPAAAKRYQEELLAEVNADREAHGKKPLDDEDEPPKAGGKKQDNTSKKKQARRKKATKKQKTVPVSTTDPECGMFHKGEHKRCFAYEAHTVCDKNGYVLEAVVTPGNVHDSVAFDDVYDKLIQSFPEVETVVADAAYKTPHICKKVFRDGRVLSTAYKRPMTMKGGHP